LDNQLTTTTGSHWLLKVAIATTTIVAVLCLSIFAVYHYRHADPYISNVLSLQGNADQGKFIFQMNCSTCHGFYGDGQVGPSLKHVSDRKSRIGLINQVISGKTPPMPQFQPNPQEMADLLKYLESL
jgi:mono/diheme cytochrome c family protein